LALSRCGCEAAVHGADQTLFNGIEHSTQEELDELRVTCEDKTKAEIAARQAEAAADRKAAKAVEKAKS
jgi:low affinity Fe/Cu permease